METRTHDFQSRPWMSKEYQHFLGPFKGSQCGLFFLDWELTEEARARISGVFTTCPPQLRQLALEHELTVSIALPIREETFNGNSCTIYGAWDHADGRISPHLEISRKSLGELLHPHMVHELCHLWFRTRPPSVRDAFRSCLLETMTADDRDVTPYATSYWRRYLEVLDDSEVLEAGRKMAVLRWTEETYCETAAALAVPGYPFDEEWNATIDLELRRQMIRSTGLKL